MKDGKKLVTNPVAKQILESYYGRIFENEKVDALLKKVSDNALNVFKILTFDLAPSRDRKPDAIRAKLSKLAAASSVKSLTATMTDLAKDNDLVNSKYAEAKRLYLEALEKFAGALNRSHEINKSKDEVILKSFKLSPNKIQTSIDNIAKEELERKKKEEEELSESYFFLHEPLNEGLFTGYRGRVENLKKVLTNLITSAEGKDQKSGYGRDWKRTFLDLDEKRKALDISGGGFGKKDKDDLADLEKQVDKFQIEFNNALVQAANRSLQTLEDDEELVTSFGDVTTLLSSGLDYLTRAYTQNKIAIQEIRAEHEEEENVLGKSVFPLKRGDTDSDAKIKNSGLIYAIQQALCNGIPAAKKLITKNAGPNGKYGPATQAVISTIQKLGGNKNTNGELDKALLDDIMSSDWVEMKDKQAIEKSLSKIRAKLNESVSPVMSISQFVGRINEEKILLNKSEFEKELDTQYKNLVGQIKKSGEDVVESPTEGGSSSGVKELSKMLRSVYSMKIEDEDFLKSDGSLKNSYSPQFIKAWTTSLMDVMGIQKKSDDNKSIVIGTSKEGVNTYTFFWFSGGLYNLHTKSTSLKSPCNWKKWSDSRNLGDLGDEDAVDFVKSYLLGWVTFGMIRPQFRYDGVRNFIKDVTQDRKSDLSNVYEMMESSIANKEVPFIPYDSLKGDIAKAFKIVTHKEEKNPDIEAEDFIAINDFLVMISNAVSFDGSKMISCLKWILDNVLGETTAKRVSSEPYDFSWADSMKDIFGKDEQVILGFTSSKITPLKIKEMSERSEVKLRESAEDSLPSLKYLCGMASSNNKLKKAIATNCTYIANEIYPSIKAHVKRMNSTSFDDVPQIKPFKCVDSKM